MHLRQVALAAVVMLGGATHAQAATYDFTYDTKHLFLGAPITASGSLDAVPSFASFYDITRVSGMVNGSAITSFDTNYGNVFFGYPADNKEYFSVSTADGNIYSFGFSFAEKNFSFPTSVSGNFTVSSVPLPASAPMFGAALLALAGLGCLAKRKRPASAI